MAAAIFYKSDSLQNEVRDSSTIRLITKKSWSNNSSISLDCYVICLKRMVLYSKIPLKADNGFLSGLVNEVEDETLARFETSYVNL